MKINPLNGLSDRFVIPQAIKNQLLKLTVADRRWHNYLYSFDTSRNSVHLAILIEPYLSYVLEGKKTIESRFSLHRQAPYERICEGDIIFLKKAGGPIIGTCQVSDAWFYQLDPKSWREINREYFADMLVQDVKFWQSRRKAAYATLIRVRVPTRIEPVYYEKSDRRGWVVIQRSVEQTRIDEDWSC